MPQVIQTPMEGPVIRSLSYLSDTVKFMHSAENVRGIGTCPSEILLNIFSFLTAFDILHLRQVSKLFRDLSYDHRLWMSLYANARVPRPPGPFPWQSCNALQDILLRSERLSQTWTCQPCEIRVSNSPTILKGDLSWILRLDRLWFMDEDQNQIICCDLQMRSRHVIWQWDRPFGFDVCLDVSVHGQTVFIYVVEDGCGYHSKLLKCEIDSDQQILPASVSWDVPLLGKRHKHSFFSRASTMYLSGDIPLVFDGTSCTFYQVPIQSTLQVFGNYQPQLLRRTQLLWIDFCTVNRTQLDHTQGLLGPVLHFRVFTLPKPGIPPSFDSKIIQKLCLTHEIIVPGTLNSTLSPLAFPPALLHANLTSEFKLLKRTLFNARREAVHECVTITLPGLSPGPSRDVTPLSVRTQTLFTCSATPATRFEVDVSEDGHARGFSQEPVPPSMPPRLVKFSIDASGDVCHAVLGDSAPTRLSLRLLDYSTLRSDLFRVDLFRGRVYSGTSKVVPERDDEGDEDEVDEVDREEWFEITTTDIEWTLIHGLCSN